MNVSTLLVTLVALALFSYVFGKQRALSIAKHNRRRLHSIPSYYGYMTALWCGLPALLLLFLWLCFETVVIEQLLIASLPSDIQSLSSGQLSLVLNDLKLLATQDLMDSHTEPMKREAVQYLLSMQATSHSLRTILVLVLAFAGAAWGLSRVIGKTPARIWVEKVVLFFLILSSTVAILTTIGIILSLLFESHRFFGEIPPQDFLFGTKWSPQTALRSDQVGSSGSFGAIPLFLGTLLISSIAMLVAVPIGLMSAIYLSEYASPVFRSIAKPVLEILAGVPTVVYGFFAALTVAPFIRHWGETIGLDVASESALATGLVMGIMIIPFISSLSDDVISVVPQALRDGSYSLGVTQSETIRLVVIPAALPGIIGGILLAFSRAIGETMIVVMAAGLSANLTINPLETVTTVTVQIVTLLTGDQEFDSAKTLAAFALAIMLFISTLILNIIALYIVRQYREEYE
ncbi:MAG: phosphate ABC transporter permease subunit PstC [Gammaproteobacteria bacterium]|nr:MAG: phosphate ABC transporter permease subunit PstC [Gammaproteobacteria bacterium]RKZ43334.1 MAG: phosphate ABC transporter permease subunit PstC [Gammaproteobacteria bacterium]RKZ75355.1 MAG: phosphate ABC transporter permease subunit PstC [Gammaproteobacteria bacterium]